MRNRNTRTVFHSNSNNRLGGNPRVATTRRRYPAE
jgi:hypothetical protein